jgi:hypothetical protein
MNAQPPNPELAALPDLLIFRPENRDFIEGTSPLLTNETSIRWLIVQYLVMLAIIFAVSGDPYGGGTWEWFSQLLLSLQGQTTQATVTGRGWENCSAVSTPDSCLIYQFTPTQGALQGQSVSVQQPVARKTNERLSDGTIVTIRYWPTDPHVARLAGADTDNLQRDVETRNILLNGSLILILLFWWRRATRRNRRLRDEGRLFRGEVVSCGKGLLGQILPPIVRLRYHVVMPDGGEHQITAQVIIENRRKPKTGTPIAVLYVNDRLHKVL